VTNEDRQHQQKGQDRKGCRYDLDRTDNHGSTSLHLPVPLNGTGALPGKVNVPDHCFFIFERSLTSCTIPSMIAAGVGGHPGM